MVILVKILKDFFLDLLAASGLIININSPMDYVNGIEKSLAGLLGLVMLYFSIKYKMILIRKEQTLLKKEEKPEDANAERTCDTD